MFDIFSRYDTTSQSSVVVKKDYNRDFEKMPSLKQKEIINKENSMHKNCACFY